MFEFSGVIQPDLLVLTRFQWLTMTFQLIQSFLEMFWPVSCTFLTVAGWF
jgi:hypothetical protein